MKKIWIGILCSMMLIGCHSSERKDWKISVDACVEKIENKETFVLVINQKSNQAGMIFQRTLEPFIREHKDLAIYEVMLDEQGDKKQDTHVALNKITEAIDSFNGSLPTMLYYEHGEVQKQIDGALSEIAWTNFLKECGLMEGEVEDEGSIKLVESEQFVNDLDQLYEAWQAGKEAYIFIHEIDRYNAEFSTTLKKQAEEKKQMIYMLNVNNPNLYNDEKMQEFINTLSIRMTPTLLHVKDKKVLKRLEDNASEEELKNWF